MTKPIPPTTLDIAAMVRGASAGFTVLLVGELLSPFASRLNGQVGALWLSLVGAAGFAAAGVRVGTSLKPWLQGALAAECALLITVPLRLMVGLDSSQERALAVSAAFGLIVGALAGTLAGRNRDRRSARPPAEGSSRSRAPAKTTPATVVARQPHIADRPARPKKKRNGKRH